MFIPLFAALQNAGVDFQRFEASRAMLFFVAFENGFFWRDYYNNHSARSPAQGGGVLSRQRVHRLMGVGWMTVCAMLAAHLMAGATGAFQPSGATDVRMSRLDDGVELWERPRPAPNRSWFMNLWEGLYEVVFPDPETFPFDRSVAFLVGISDYAALDQLPFVRNDIDDLRAYLLDAGGFDQVYVVRDQQATPDLVEDHMINRFARLGPRDRLLFYYSGHGADIGGETGYLQFANAPRDRFTRGDHLAIRDRSREWARVIRAGHVLMVFDACASGFGFAPKEGGDVRAELLNALSGERSRAVITAGTADENSYEVKGPDGRGNGVFTRAFLDALRGGGALAADGFITSGELIAEIRNRVARFRDESGQTMTPRLWELNPDGARGTFVFLDPTANPTDLPEEYRRRVGAVPRGGAGDDVARREDLLWDSIRGRCACQGRP